MCSSTKKSPENKAYKIKKSARRDSNPRPRPWQGRTPPTEPLAHTHILSLQLKIVKMYTQNCLPNCISYKFFPIFWLNPRPISNHQLNTLLYLHLGPIYLVVFKGSYCFHIRYPILRGASRLDAFSVYPFPT